MDHKPTIGLEIHIELKTKTKMFCRCLNDPFCKDPNIHVCPVCLGLPGALPYPNKQAVISTIMLGKLLDCQIAEFSKWDRKHYFYPDLPKGYQISQYDLPIARNGELKFKIQNSKFKIIRVRRIHLEEDTGKLLHVGAHSLIDYNRAGVPLVELVTEPDIESAWQAKTLAQEIQKIVRHHRISEANMEKGEMRVEANVSLLIQKSKVKNQKLGTKVEVKNLNSFRSVERAIDFEIKRQALLLEKGEPVRQETRGWDETKGLTFTQRVKETEADYRYFPEPDLPPLHLGQLAEVQRLGEIETIEQKRDRYVTEYGLSQKVAEVILADRQRSSIFEATIKLLSKKGEAKNLANLLVNRPQVLSRSVKEIVEISSQPAHIQKQILDHGQSIEKVSIKSEAIDLREIIGRIIKENKRAIDDFKSGKQPALGFLIGQVMKSTPGLYDPNQVKERLIEMIK